MESFTTNFHYRHTQSDSSGLDPSDFVLYINNQQLFSSDLTTIPTITNSLSSPDEHGLCNNSWYFRVSGNSSKLCNSNTSEQTNTSTVELLASVYFPLTAYILPLMIALSTVNNSLVLYVMLRSKRYKELTAKNVCFSRR